MAQTMLEPRFFVHVEKYVIGFFTLLGAEQWIANEILEGRLKPGQAAIYDDSGIKL